MSNLLERTYWRRMPFALASVCVALLCVPVALAMEAEPGFRSLYNGKSFDGWAGPTRAWDASNGVIRCQPKRGGTIYTDEEFEDFVVRLEYKLPEGGNNGLAIRYPGQGDSAYVGMCEIQLLDDDFPRYDKFDPRKFTGAAYNMAAPKRGHQRPAGEWNDMEVKVEGPTVVVVLNGVEILNADLSQITEFVGNKPHPGKDRVSGHFGFCGHGHEVEFRNIRIKELPLSQQKTPKPVAAGEWQSLFNGHDLAGWKVPEGDGGHWQVVDGVIDYDAQSESPGSKNLWTEKEFDDFELKLDWRLTGAHGEHGMPNILPDATYELDADGRIAKTFAPNADSGVLLRGYGKAQINIWCWPCGSGEVYGYRSDAKLPREIRAACIPAMRADRPLGEWNTFLITLRGDRLKVTLNDEDVIRDAQLPGLKKRGPIGLQHHGGINSKTGQWSTASSLVQFRNIFIRELTP